jgi:transcriptional regulator with XRE-family HTH domain
MNEHVKLEDLGPAVQRALLTQEMKRLRAGVDLTQEEVANDRGWSVSKFTRIENGVTPVSKSDLEGLLRLYNVTDKERVDELLTLAAGARERGWWLEYYSGPDKAYEAYLGYEDGASSIHEYQGLTIPGLLQTEAYIRELMTAFNEPQELIEQTVRLRLMRQRGTAEKSPEQRYIVDEAVLRRPVGKVMPDQLRHILRVAKKPAVDLRIIPMKAGLHMGLRGAFILLGFGKLMPDVLYLEGVRRGDLLIAEQEAVGSGATDVIHPFDEIATYIDGFSDLTKIALPPGESMDFIEQVIEQMLEEMS